MHALQTHLSWRRAIEIQVLPGVPCRSLKAARVQGSSRTIFFGGSNPSDTFGLGSTQLSPLRARSAHCLARLPNIPRKFAYWSSYILRSSSVIGSNSERLRRTCRTRSRASDAASYAFTISVIMAGEVWKLAKRARLAFLSAAPNAASSVYSL